MGWTCSTYGKMRNAYKILAMRYEGKRPLGKPRRRRKNSVKVGRIFSLHHCVKTGSGAHPASYLMGTAGSYLGSKAAGA